MRMESDETDSESRLMEGFVISNVGLWGYTAQC
jgi:hypothetical protein